jgi:hypothetical protein
MGTERRRSTEDELELSRQTELAFLRKFRTNALKYLARLPKRSRSSSLPLGRL